jgi:hypothetical protein
VYCGGIDGLILAKRGILAQPPRFEVRQEVMNGDSLVKLIEEMMDLKVQQYAESNLKHNPEVARLLIEKRETDRRRLEQIRAELARLMNAKIFGVVPVASVASRR